MEQDTMGRVLVAAKIENLRDAWEAEIGVRPADQARSVIIDDALVDTGATTLSLPTHMIRQLGLKSQAHKRIKTSGGEAEATMYDAVRLTIQDRFCTVDVMEVPDSVPALIGQIPLEMLDFVIDTRNRRLIGNPEHGGEHVIELY